MRGFNTKKAQSCKDGGLIRGPGTGTSDSIPRGFKPGTFIMPADSTKAIGPDVLENIAKVPTKVSNGEFAHTPQEVHAVGINALRQMKDATHNAKDDGVYFANGGQVRGFKPEPQRLVDGDVVKRRQISAQNIYPQGSPSAGADIYANVGRGPAAPSVLETDPQAQADRSAISKMASGIRDANQNAGRAILDVASIVPRGLAGAYDSAVVRPMRAAGINAGYLSPHLVPDGVDPASMTPFTDQKRLQERNAAGAGRGFVNPSLSSKAVAPVTNLTVPETLTDAQRGGGNVDAVEAPTTQPSAQPAPAQPVAQALAQVPSLAPVQAQGFQAPSVRHSGNNWKSENDLRNARVSASSITANGGRFDQTRKGQISPQAATYAAMLGTDQALQQAQPGMAQAAMRENAGLQREGMQQTGANQRAGMGFQTAQQRLAMDQETQGFANRAAQQSEQLRNTLLDPNATPEQRKQAQQALMTLQGKSANGEWGVQVTPATKNVDGSTTAGSIVRYNKATGQTEVVGQPGQGGGAQPSANHLAALKANPKQAAQFDEVYGPGAAARALKGG